MDIPSKINPFKSRHCGKKLEINSPGSVAQAFESQIKFPDTYIIENNYIIIHNKPDIHEDFVNLRIPLEQHWVDFMIMP